MNSLWQVPVLSAAGWVAARALARVGIAAEHGMWVGVLLLESIVPALSTLPLDWLRAWWPWHGSANRIPAGEVSVQMGAGVELGSLNFPAAVLTSLGVVYGLATAYFVARFLWRWARLSALRERIVPLELEGDLGLSWRCWMDRFGLVDVALAKSAGIFAPVTYGILRRVVVLPFHMVAALPVLDLDTVIAHELAHVQRNDFIKNLLYEIVSLPVSYNPLSWFTRERVTETREMICDQMAAGVAGEHAYARSLLRLASLLATGRLIRLPHAIGIFDANTFERRVMRLTAKTNRAQGLKRSALISACVLFGGAICGSALALHLSIDPGAAYASASKASAVRTATAKEMAEHRLSGPVPIYPADAKKARIQGTVVLSAIIGKDGNVEKLVVVSGPKELQTSALDAVRQWIYKPYLIDGQPVEIKTTVNVTYSLQK